MKEQGYIDGLEEDKGVVEDRWFATAQDGGFQCRVRKDGLEASTAERLKWTESSNSPYI